MRCSLVILLASSLSLSAATAPMEVWLTPDRKAALERITSRPRVVAQEQTKDGAVLSRWTNGSREWSTTNRPGSVLGKRAVNAWQQKLDAKSKEKQDLLDDLNAVKNTPTKKTIEAIISKHGKKE